jgi:TatD DNase family protein
MHPNNGSAWTKDTLSKLRVLAREFKVVAIGEIGLDYYRHHTPRDLQKSIFWQQLELAAELFLPVIVHNREASSDILDLLREWHKILITNGSRLIDNPGVMHSFSGDGDFAAQFSRLNYKLGINGPVTFKNSLELQSMVASQPIETILVETDAPFLTPHPFRGKRNEPANVRIVVEKIAELRDAPLDIVAKITTAGADKLFRWREIH